MNKKSKKGLAAGGLVFVVGLVLTIMLAGGSAVLSNAMPAVLIRDSQQNPNVPGTTFYEVTSWDRDFELGYAYNKIWTQYSPPASTLISKDINELSILLGKVGNPTGSITTGVFDGTGQLVYPLGAATMDKLTATSDPTWLTFREDTAWTMRAGDRIGVQYTSGDLANYVMVYVQSTNPITDSVRQRYNGTHWFSNQVEDMTMVVGFTPGGAPQPGTDTTNPTITISSPIDGATVSSPITVTGSASDAGGLTMVEARTLWFNPTTQTNIFAPYKAVTTSNNYASWTVSLTATQVTSITVRATDQSGNVAWRNVNVNFVTGPSPPPGDTTRPAVMITSPSAGAALSSPTVAVSGTATDNVAVTNVAWSIDSSPYTPISLSGNTFTFAALDVQQGSHTISIRATDSSGNVEIQSVAFQVAVVDPNPDPTPGGTMVDPATVMGVGIATSGGLGVLTARRYG